MFGQAPSGLISYRDDICRVETFPVPRRAMQEAVINALIHREYAEPSSTQIRVNDEDIEIRNSAQLPPDWVAADTGTLSRSHNPRIAQTFFRTGVIEAWGRGIRQIWRRQRVRRSGHYPDHYPDYPNHYPKDCPNRWIKD